MWWIEVYRRSVVWNDRTAPRPIDRWDRQQIDIEQTARQTDMCSLIKWQKMAKSVRDRNTSQEVG